MQLDAQLAPAAWEPAWESALCPGNRAGEGLGLGGGGGGGGRTFWAHGGFLRAARAILDDCGCRAALERLREAGYSLTIVGHSLGGGVGTLLTALLLFGERATQPDPSLPPPPPPPEPYANIRCIAYACPACVDLALSLALKPVLTSLTHNDDAVPRLSDANCRQLAMDLIADDVRFKEVRLHARPSLSPSHRTRTRTQDR